MEILYTATLIVGGLICMDRKKYYVNVRSREISQIAFQNNNDFTIYATTTEVTMLRKKLDDVHRAELDTFWRSHVPILPYHRDGSNERYDKALLESFQMIYELGDEAAKDFMSESGLLSHLSLSDE